MNIFTLFKLFSSKKKARKNKGWLKYFPSASKLFSIKGIQESVMDELSPLLKIIFPKTDESIYRTITLVAIINASLYFLASDKISAKLSFAKDWNSST